MSRKATISKEDIINAAFNITAREGFDKITSRGLAAEAGCSTQPIFRIYENMDSLKKDVYDKAAGFYEEFYKKNNGNSETPFKSLGMAYMSFARKYPQLFRLLFLSSRNEDLKSMYDLVNGGEETVAKEVQRAARLGCKDPNGLFMKMWIFIHGAACMAVTGDNDLDDAQFGAFLESCYKDFNS